MDISKEQLAEMLRVEAFPRSAKCDPEWVLANEMGPNAVWLTEWPCEAMALEPGQRVLDMGCGKAMSSVFLAKEFGVQVWATDLWIQATDNWQRIQEAGVADRVFPMSGVRPCKRGRHSVAQARLSVVVRRQWWQLPRSLPPGAPSSGRRPSRIRPGAHSHVPRLQT